MAQLVVALGGRAAEEIVFNEISTGAHGDLSRISEIARNMVTQFGMSERLGHITYGIRHDHIFLGRDIHEEKNYSDETARLIDQEVKRIVDGCYKKAKDELLERKDQLKALAETLLEKETLDDKEVKNIIGIKDADTEDAGSKDADTKKESADTKKESPDKKKKS